MTESLLLNLSYYPLLFTTDAPLIGYIREPASEVRVKQHHHASFHDVAVRPKASADTAISYLQVLFKSYSTGGVVD